MTNEELARRLKPVQMAMDALRPGCPRPEQGLPDAYVTIDAASDSPYPSANWNAVRFAGWKESLTEADVDRILERFQSAEVGYLGWAATGEAFRGQGGQNALIRARINRAVALGCRWVVSETLYLLAGSLRNLRRNGFDIVYDKKVYVWEREGAQGVVSSGEIR